MKKRLTRREGRWVMVLSLILCYLFFSTVGALAQPAWVKKATKSVFTLKTFGDDGALIGSATGFFVTADGVGVSSFAPFKGAARAIIIDAGGKEMPVACMLGANETYDVSKFRVAVKKSQPLVLAARQQEGSPVWLLPYREVKQVAQGKVRKIETFNQTYDYYTLDLQQPEGCEGAPLMNEAGEVVGLMQPSSSEATVSYAVSARFADSLSITGLSINDAALRSTKIKKDLPDDEGQALLTVYVAGSTLDSLSYATLLDDFIAKFPQSAEGYVNRAQEAANGGRYAAADNDIAQALKVADRPDEVHYSYSRMIYQTALYRPEAYDSWTMDKALKEAQEASAVRPLAVYGQQQAYVLFAQKKYEESYTIYEQLFDTVALQPTVFYEASRCKELLNDTTAQLALLDRAVGHFSKPYLREAAPYLLVRAQANQSAGNFRKAVLDLNDYEGLMKTQVNDQFYFLRFQAEVGGRLYQQALNDIDRAITMAPDNDFYPAEKASLLVRVGMYDEAMETARAMIQQYPDHSDGYLFLGLSQCLKGEKGEGVKNLQKAGELGDPQAAGLIEKYSK